jgi:cytochrome c oxidase accessory protein FixG
MARSLPILGQSSPGGALLPDGSRRVIVPADVTGPYTRRRNVLFLLLVLIYVALPWIQIGGHPAVFLDLSHRAFFLFGATFNAQDTWLSFFLLSGVGFALIVVTALWGRVWCGYACPHTVFLEGVFRRIERLLEGPRNTRLRRDKAPLSFDRVWRKSVKHLTFFLLSFLVAHVFLSYFVSIPAVLEMMRARPAEHPEAFAWAFGMTAVMYGNFGWFREQMCLIICPYGRLQSVLTDNDTLVIGYDQRRGEPRGKAKEEHRGDCVDCGRCVVVCPTSIDIRNGLQLECVGCSACVDACDDVMTKLQRPTGLIRYDSQNGLNSLPKRFLRPRIYVYALLGVVGLTVAAFAFRARTPFEANLLRLQGALFVMDPVAHRVRNAVELHLVNKHAASTVFRVSGTSAQDLEYVIPMAQVTLGSLEERRIPIFVLAPDDGVPRTIRIRVDDGSEPQVVQAPFVAP